MKDALRGFRAERVKWRKNWPLLVAILVPLCQVIFLGILTWYSGERVHFFKPGFLYWAEINCVVWNLFFMPVSVALIAELSWSLESYSKTWPLVFIQPIEKKYHYFIKCLSHFSLVFISQLILMVLLIPVGLILKRNEELFMGNVMYFPYFKFALYSFIAALPVISFHTFLSMRFPGLWIALGVGLLGTGLCTRFVGGSLWVQGLPWGLSSQVTLLFERWRVLPWAYSWCAIISMVVWMLLGTCVFKRRQIFLS